MAALASDHSIASAYTMAQLVEGATRVDDIVGRALEQGARGPGDDVTIRQEVVAVHLHAVQGWSKIADTLPTTADPADAFDCAWRLVDELLFAALRDAVDPVSSEQIWQELLTELAAQATAVLCEIYQASTVEYAAHGETTPFAPHDVLMRTYPYATRQLLEWALCQRDYFTAPLWSHASRPWRVNPYIVRTLGAVGDASTADMLRHYIHDPDLGETAVSAIRVIEARCM